MNSATVLQFGSPIGSIVFSVSMLTFVIVWVSRETVRQWRRGWLESGHLADHHMSKWDPVVTSTAGRIANDRDRARFAYDLGTNARHSRRQALTAMICGICAGAGVGAMLGSAYLPEKSDVFPTYVLVILSGAVVGQLTGLTGAELWRRAEARMNALSGAAFALAYLLELQPSSSQYWRRRGRITRINRLKTAYVRAAIPTRDLTSPGLPEIDTDADWEAFKEKSVTLLARAYLGDFLEVDEDKRASLTVAERVGMIALVGAALAAIPAIWSAVQKLGTAVVWLREHQL